MTVLVVVAAVAMNILLIEITSEILPGGGGRAFARISGVWEGAWGRGIVYPREKPVYLDILNSKTRLSV